MTIRDELGGAERGISGLRSLSEAERRQLLMEWNRTTRVYPRNVCVHELFEEKAKQAGQAIAAEFDDDKLSYAELSRRSNQLARHLRSLGVGPDVLVGLSMDRSSSLLVGMLGILKAGGAYVPLDPEYPVERLAFMLEDTQAPVLLTQAGLRERLPGGYAGHVVALDAQWEEIARESEEAPRVVVGAENLAYVIYTSGSTGTPKGVQVTHRAINRLVCNTNYIDIKPTDRFAQASVVSFDAATFEIWGALLHGAQVVRVSRNVLLSPRDFAEFLRTRDITVLFLTTALFNQMAREAPGSFRALRYMLFGGEAVDAGAVRAVLREGPPQHLLHVYGPTEVTTFSTWHPVAELDEAATTVPIGRPIANTTTYVLDEHRQPVPVGVPGELYLGGDGLARGYLRRAELTAERFVDHPFSQEAGARLYRTGDWVRYLPDGAIEFIGRRDSQVKVRGFRIELGEIEIALSRLPQVQEAVVVAREDTPGDKRVVAYVVPRSGQAGAMGDLRGHLKQHLPDYMVPSAFVTLDKLPLTPNGKVDRKALPAPEWEFGSSEAYVTPRTPAEEALAEIFSTLLGVKRVGIHDNFFEMGGHSLTATQLASRLRERFDVEISIDRLFDIPTVAALAAEIKELIKDDRTADPSVLNIKPRSRDGNPPLSFSQARVWFVQQMDPSSSAYNYQGAVHFKGQLDVGVLERCLTEIVRRHEIYRTTFPAVDGQPVQFVHDPWDVQLRLIDLSGASESQRHAEAERLIRDEGRKPFDLTQLPLVKWFMLRLNESHHVLAHIDHHLVHDGWSLNVLLGEIAELYRAYSERRTSPLKELPIQFADFADWQRNWMDGTVLQSGLSYWRRQLAGSPSLLELPCDRPRPPLQSFNGGLVQLRIPSQLSNRLRDLSSSGNVTLFTSMQAVFALLLSRYSGQDDICVGAGIANRRWPHSEGLIGMIINNIVLRHDLSGDPSFRELQQRAFRVIRDALKYQDVPFDKVVDEIRPVRSGSHNPLFQVMFSFHDSPLPELKLPGLTMTHQEMVHNGSAKFDLSVMAIPRREQRVGIGSAGDNDHIELFWEYNTDLFDRSTIERLAHHYERMLQHVVENPERRLSELQLLTDAEKHQLLVEWNDTKTDYPADALMHELFEAQAARTPEHIAVVHEECQLTYGELNARANRLAHYLRILGVKPDARVAVCVERGIEMVVGLLAVLKAGGAYVPLDPTYPAERLTYMLQDSTPAAILTDAQVPASVQAELRSALVGLADAIPLINLQAVANPWATQPTSNPERIGVGLNSAHLAYVIYTSGSTGKPKGVAIEHRNAVNFLYWAQASFTAAQLARTLFSTSLNFDLAMYECFAPLTVGATTQIVRNALDLVRAPQAVTLINTVPSAINALLDANGVPETVRTVNLAGEPLKRALVERLFARTKVDTVCNLYGPSETTTYSTWVAMRRERGFVAHIGRPLANTRIYLLDARGQPVPVGMVGEMYIGGAGVARGYLNRREVTAERFLLDPFANEPNARMYRTGDLARYLPDGNIEFLGRNDFQVKLRGYRIELGEIESALSQHPAVREVVVLAREDSPGDKRLVAYLVAKDPSAELVDLLRAHLRASLPEYMVPAAFVTLEKLPLTPNGKVDRKGLPAPDGGAYASRGYEAPVGEVEERLAQIWAEVLKLERVGRHDNFFELGGHSLLAVSVIEHMRRAGLHAEVRALFVTPTLCELAQAVGRESGIVEVPPNRIPADCTRIEPVMLPLVRLAPEEIARIVAAVPGGAANVQDIYPLAPLQEGILFHHLMARKGDPYLLHALYSFDSRERLQSYLQALRAVIERHDILRTAVLWEGLPEPVQVVWRKAPLVVEEVDLDAGKGDIAEQLRARFDPRLYRLDVREAPLLRVFIAEDGANARWVMLLLFHHLAIDHTTLETMQKEIQACLLGQAERLPKPLPFRNFVAQARLGVPREEHEAFFRKLLADVEEPTAPFGLTDVQGDGSGVVEARRAVDAQLARRLRERARALGVSAASVCHLAWAQVLARTSGRDDVVFGTLLFGRMQGGEGADRVLGLFINTLPVRIRIGEETVQDGVRATHAQLAQLLRHEHASLALAQRCSAVAAPAPLFSALLNYRHTAGAGQRVALAREAWAGVQYLRSEERTNYPFVLSVDDLGEDFALIAQVQSPLDPRRVCGFMHRALEELVGALEDAPATPLRSLDVLPESERRQVLEEWNDTRTDYPAGASVHELFEAQARSTPDAVAVEYEGARLTYRELNTRANQVARYLTRHGVGPEVMVGLCVERSLEMVVGTLGILKAGGAYVPLDPEYPVERLAFMLEDTQAPVLLTQAGLRERLPGGYAGHVVALDAQWEEIARESEEAPRVVVGAENLAYVIYTSGSTGRPKGTAIEHRSVVRLVKNTNYIELGPQEVFLQFAPISFDASTLELWGPLLNGAKLVVCPAGRLSLEDLGRVIQERGVTTLWLTAALFHQMVDTRIESLRGVRQLLAGGETLSVPHVRRMLGVIGAGRLINGYGPTENTTFTCCHVMTADTRIEHTVPIGRPISNTRVYILDSQRQPVPVGVYGELYIGGDGLAREYLHQPELTAEKFVPDPFDTTPRARLYRTGDLVRYLPDGNIEFLGRNDNQVKVRGYRIELGEVEYALGAHPGVREAVVLCREDAPGERRLVAYVTCGDGGKECVTASELRAHLRERLPEHMMPAVFVVLERLPVTANGKVDRAALPAPEGERQVEGEYVAPRDAIEERLAAIWREVLGVERVGVHDNFFELGGHSLLAIKIVVRTNETLGVDLPLSMVFERSTISSFAEAVANADLRVVLRI